ncbi:hypothetical protein [Parabacteroides goldsteinii]|uniref:hypothetical protein n=1 Tax=Parabacteroides goldsteinii TaxID=328812 RepID=UPI00259B9CA1|nr:hypothetical protein [Parabacteroides goldsteinii]
MKKGIRIFLLVILAFLLFVLVDDYFWQRNREREIEQVIVTMQNSVDELKNFFQKNEDDLEYLIKKCIEDDLIIYTTSIQSLRTNDTQEVAVEQEVLSRRDRLITNLPSNIKFYHITPSGIKFNNKDALFGTLHIKIFSPPFTEESGGYIAGSIGTIEVNRTWIINVATQDYPDYVRACKVLKRMKEQNK